MSRNPDPPLEARYSAGDRDWVVDLRLRNGLRRRIGASGHASREQAIGAAIRRFWKPLAKVSGRCVPYGEHAEKVSVLSCTRINGSET